VVQHGDGTPFDLSQNGGYTVRMFVHEDGQKTDGVNIVNDQEVTVVTPVLGICSWPFDLSTAAFNNTRGTWRLWLT
jgi:hypothetical protein